MSECNVEIIGIKSLTLHQFDNARLEFPDISNENQANIIASGLNSYEISDIKSNITWERNLNYSQNYKQIYSDEINFIVHGIENQNSEIIQTIRNTRCGFLVEVSTISGQKWVFQTPFFINKSNTKQIDSHSWIISISYKIPTFKDKLIKIATILTNNKTIIESNIEIIGIKSIALYINKDVIINRPDPSKENEIDIIAHATGSYIIAEENEYPKWERTINNSGNFKQNFVDEFSFILHGVENVIPKTLKDLRNNRLGYIVEIITTGNQSFVFPEPVFLNSTNTKKINSNSWNVSLSYRLPTFKDKLKKLNTLLMTNSYILVDNDTIMGYNDTVIVSN